MGSFTSSADLQSALPYALDDFQVTAIIEFFQTLDRWEREAHGQQIV
jgi:hypothetical protein